MSELQASNVEALRNVVALLLDDQQPAWSLRPEVLELTALLTAASTAGFQRRDDIAAGETRTSHGIAISPTMAAMCADDYVRTITFIRGLHGAVVDCRRRIADRPVRVLYVGCGPLATLAVPLMAMFPAEEVMFTLLDIHAESTASARSIVEVLGFAASVEAIETTDASEYRVNPESPPDIILTEILQACLEAEPQVTLTRHLLPQAPDAIFVPEEVSIDLVLANLSREFAAGGTEQNGATQQRDRIPLGAVFVVNRETVAAWQGNCGRRLPGAIVRLPEFFQQRYQPMLFTRIRVFQQQVLDEYHSGLTCPRVLPVAETLAADDALQFYYELGRHPRLCCEVVRPS